MNLTSFLRGFTPCALAALASFSDSAQAAENWQLSKVDQFMVSAIGANRTQGVSSDGSNWYFSWNAGLESTDLGFNRLKTANTPFSLLLQGLDHMGDFDEYEGILYVPMDRSTNGYEKPRVALFNAKNLSYTGKIYTLQGAPNNREHDIASWIAVNGAAGVAYGKEWQDGNTLNTYRMSDWSFSGTLKMDRSLSRIQGAELYRGALYMSSDNSTQSVYRVDLGTGHVDELFRLPTPEGDREVEGLAVRELPGGGAELAITMNVIPKNAPAHIDMFRYTLAPVPEPQSYALMLAGLGALSWVARRRRGAPL